MIHRITLLALGLMLLFATSAEAVTGHCGKAQLETAPVMSAHCAEMMGIELPTQPEEAPDTGEASVCCCAISATPVLLVLPAPDAPFVTRSNWAAPTAITGPPGTTLLDPPPPRI